MAKAAVVDKAVEEQDLTKEPELDDLEEGLDDLVIDTELPEDYEMEVDAAERLGLVTTYNRLDLALRTAKNTGQQEARINEITRDKSYASGQLQRLDLKWKKRGRLSAFKNLMRVIAQAQVKQTVLRREEFLKPK